MKNSIRVLIEKNIVTVSRSRKPSKKELKKDPTATSFDEDVVINFDDKTAKITSENGVLCTVDEPD